MHVAAAVPNLVIPPLPQRDGVCGNTAQSARGGNTSVRGDGDGGGLGGGGGCREGNREEQERKCIGPGARGSKSDWGGTHVNGMNYRCRQGAAFHLKGFGSSDAWGWAPQQHPRSARVMMKMDSRVHPGVMPTRDFGQFGGRALS